MQAHAIVFAAVQAGACLYAAGRGGRPEQAVAGMMALAAIATGFTSVHHAGSFAHVEWARAGIDLLLLVGLVGLALIADRYWPMYVAALHLVGVAVHGVRSYNPAILPIVYYQLTALAAYPMILLLVVGTRRHRVRAAHGGAERAWSFAT